MSRLSTSPLALAPPLGGNKAQGCQQQHGSPRTRRKLQKTVSLPPTLSQSSTRRLAGTPSALATNGKKAAPIPRLKTSFRQPVSDREPATRALPDLSDAKWLEYVRSHHSKESLKLPCSMVRDLSYLSVNPKPFHRLSHRPSSKMSASRRRAKTPVFSIGQLEGVSLDHYGSPTKIPPTSELIAQQYRELIDYDADSIYSDAQSEPSPSRQGYRDDEYIPRRQRSSDDISSNRVFSSTEVGDAIPAASPTSDDGTLVSFEEETVYFKPVSFSPEPRSPAHMHSSSISSSSSNPFASPNNLSLQICLDLLARELSTAFSDRRQRPTNEISALQIWVMIEAFERLRDQVAEMRLGISQVSGVETMFETWLQALYTIHDSLATENLARNVDKDDFEGLEEALD